MEVLQAAGQSPRTIQSRIAVITRLSAHLGIDPSTAATQQLAGWLARPGWKRATRAIYLYHTQAYCLWAFSAGLADADPSAGLRRIRVPQGPPRPIPTSALAQILRHARRPYLLYFALASYAGLRCAEIAVLEREDISAEALTVHGKGGKVRIVPTHDLLWRLLEPLPPGPVLHLPPYPPHIAAHKLSMYGSRQLTRLGFPTVSMHMLRHWFGTETFRRSRNIRATQELLGHASVAATQRYTQVSSEERRAVIQALPTVA